MREIRLLTLSGHGKTSRNLWLILSRISVLSQSLSSYLFPLTQQIYADATASAEEGRMEEAALSENSKPTWG